MNRHAFLYCAVLLLIVFAGCSQDRSTAPDQSASTDHTSAVTADPEAVADEIVARAGWAVDPEVATDSRTGGPARTGGDGCVNWFEREVIVDDIVHYYFEVQVGSGPYDVIGLHRVVREPIECRPARAKKSVMLLHGSNAGFGPVYLYGSALASAPDDQSIAVFLAQNGVDVWGIDLRWVLVPQGITDFTFMANWDLQLETDDLQTAMATARLTRLLTGNGFRRMHLLGYSRGVRVGFAYLNRETQIPRGFRHAAGFIPVDLDFKTDWEERRLLTCATADNAKGAIDSGIYQDEVGVLAITLSYLAQSDPDGTSPVFPPMTNYQAILFIGANTYLLADYPQSILYHFVAGVPGPGGVTTELIYTDELPWIEFLGAWSPYMPNVAGYEMSAITCDEIDSPYDDHLADIKVPVLYVGAGGGAGESGVYTLSLLGSTDVTTLIVDFEQPENRLLDFGHVDLFSANNAAQDVWTPILTWIGDHTPGGHHIAKQWKE
jgi:pimeloyl-ACP methyl ester carboxylesterase